MIAAESSSNPLSLIVGGMFLAALGVFGYYSSSRSRRVPRRVREAEPGLTQEQFNSRNMRGTMALAAVGIVLVVWGLIDLLADQF